MNYIRNPKSEIRNGQAGLTMLEMLVAVAILAIGIAGVLQAFSTSMITCKAAESYSTAAMLAQQAVSELERRPRLDPGNLSGTFGDTASGYTWEAEIQQATDSGLQKVRLTVLWGPEGNQRHFSMVTCLRPGYEQQQEKEAQEAEQQNNQGQTPDQGNTPPPPNGGPELGR